MKQNFKSLTECLDVGIIPIPNFIIGFPEETFESIRNTMDGLIRLGIYCKPHFATPYPGSEWYYTYKHDILKQYHGSLESFIEDLGDASKITAVISHNFSALELLGFQQMMVNRDRRSLDLAERHWGEAQITWSHWRHQWNPLISFLKMFEPHKRGGRISLNLVVLYQRLRRTGG